MCKYLDPKTTKLTDIKRKLVLKDEDGNTTKYFVIPLKDPKLALLISPDSDQKDRHMWNDKLVEAEEIWKR